MSEYKNGTFEEPISVGDAINTSYARESYPFIAADESYIIFSRDSRRFDSQGNKIAGDRKLMISFRDKDKNWKKPVILGPSFSKARFPSVSPDGLFLFFTKYSDEDNEDLKAVEFK